jgi:shikimate dehydrogenase
MPTVAVTGATRVVGIFGEPVAHSHSPTIHNAAFAALGLDYVYVAFHVRPVALAGAVAAVRALDLRGVNVTVPHKERVIPLLDSLSRVARTAGAVNTIVNRAGHLHGDNTDIVGFLASLGRHRRRVRGGRAVVIGAGGAARAVVTALQLAAVREIRVVNRTLRRAAAIAQRFGGPRTRLAALPLAALREAATLADADCVVNTTSLGWRGERFLPLAYAATPRHCLFYDLVYGRSTAFLRGARAARRPVMDGTEMLVRQGAAAFTLWTGRRPPLDVLRAALGVGAAELTTGSPAGSLQSPAKRGAIV